MPFGAANDFGNEPGNMLFQGLSHKRTSWRCKTD